MKSPFDQNGKLPHDNDIAIHYTAYLEHKQEAHRHKDLADSSRWDILASVREQFGVHIGQTLPMTPEREELFLGHAFELYKHIHVDDILVTRLSGITIVVGNSVDTRTMVMPLHKFVKLLKENKS